MALQQTQCSLKQNSAAYS